MWIKVDPEKCRSSKRPYARMINIDKASVIEVIDVTIPGRPPAFMVLVGEQPYSAGTLDEVMTDFEDLYQFLAAWEPPSHKEST